MIIFFWIIFSLVTGSVGSKRNIGFGGAFLLSIFLSPLIGLILAFNSDKKAAKTYVSPTMLKLIKKGDKLVRAHRYEEAIDLYTSALTYSNQAPNTHFKLAKLFSIEKDINKSLKHGLAPIILEYYSTFHNNLLSNLFLPQNEVFIHIPFFHWSNLS